jgi:hypothetical protein
LRSCPEPLGLPPFALRMVWHRQETTIRLNCGFGN